MFRTTRRAFLRHSTALAGLGAGAALLHPLSPASVLVGETLPAWRPGDLDIHHINTGRGNSALMICPDGTSVLIDAGASNSAVKFLNPARPNDSRRAGQWIGRYARRQLRPTQNGDLQNTALDHVILTHLHPDHLGEVGPASPRSASGNYFLTGISDVEEEIHIRHLVDRGYPSYSYPQPPQDPSALNYIAFVRSLAARGSTIERVQVGRTDQVNLKHDAKAFPSFSVRMLAGNGEVWTGSGEQSTPHFPANPSSANQSSADLPSENMCSIALKVSYGQFTCFTGGDLTCDTNYGRDPWRDIETPVTRACGPVSVATVDHHGYYDAAGPDSVRALRPRVWILQAWHASHPAISTLANLYSTQLYSGSRDVFSVGLKDEAALTTARFSDLMKSRDGHVLVRVSAPGDRYQVIILDDTDESDRIKASFGPYIS